MYSFVKSDRNGSSSSRLFMKGTRGSDDHQVVLDTATGIHDNNNVSSERHVSHSTTSATHHEGHGLSSFETKSQLAASQSSFEAKSQLASASQESRELVRRDHLRSGLKTVSTQRIVRKTTTISMGERSESNVKVCLMIH